MATPNVTQRHPTLRRKPAYGRWIAASYRQGWVAWASDESQPFHEAITVADIKRLEDLLWACSCAAAPRALMHTVHGCAKPLSRARCWHVPCTIRRDFRKMRPMVGGAVPTHESWPERYTSPRWSRELEQLRLSLDSCPFALERSAQAHDHADAVAVFGARRPALVTHPTVTTARINRAFSRTGRSVTRQRRCDY